MVLQEAALRILRERELHTKIAAVRSLARDLESGNVAIEHPSAAVDLVLPGRPEQPRLVSPRKLPRRRLSSPEGRVALLHAVAHIECNAIDLAIDAAYRFARMPAAYYVDWVSVAVDEARHFEMLEGRLRALGSWYGQLPAHNGLWQAARDTQACCLERMALVPRVLEARGLDVTPGMIERLRSCGDENSVGVLEIILEEEKRHVRIGSDWFRYCCQRDGREPSTTFLELISEHGAIRGPFNWPARLAAGFDEVEKQQMEARW